ncbi:MAG: GspH/FimT family pseudopilin [Acidobacteria bacterium]|nr:GspH/FimT family pseudopilin [Acidobacteriota bacterium]
MDGRDNSKKESSLRIAAPRLEWVPEYGFSLVELILVVAIGMVLVGFAVPTFQSAMRSHTINSTANNVTRLMQMARFAAIRQGSSACTVLEGNILGVDADCDGLWDPTATAVALPSGVILIDSGPATDEMNFSTDPVAVPDPFVITFNSRGITTISPTVSLIYVTGWDRFAAVSVSGSGRARTWRYDGETWR